MTKVSTLCCAAQFRHSLSPHTIRALVFRGGLLETGEVDAGGGDLIGAENFRAVTPLTTNGGQVLRKPEFPPAIPPPATTSSRVPAGARDPDEKPNTVSPDAKSLAWFDAHPGIGWTIRIARLPVMISSTLTCET